MFKQTLLFLKWANSIIVILMWPHVWAFLGEPHRGWVEPAAWPQQTGSVKARYQTILCGAIGGTFSQDEHAWLTPFRFRRWCLDGTNTALCFAFEHGYPEKMILVKQGLGSPLYHMCSCFVDSVAPNKLNKVSWCFAGFHVLPNPHPCLRKHFERIISMLDYPWL